MLLQKDLWINLPRTKHLIEDEAIGTSQIPCQFAQTKRDSICVRMRYV